MGKAKAPVEHNSKLQVAGHFPNWVIQFICSCGHELGVAATFTVDELSKLLLNHTLDTTFTEKEEDVSEDKTDS
jgi:hypothetical protein